MHIGLIGGIGPAATDYYYRKLIADFASRHATLDLTIVHADTPTLLGNLASGDAAAQIAIYHHLTARLVAAGADCVVVTSIAGHFCIDGFAATSPLPVIDMIAEVNQAISDKGLKRLGILGTRTVMETHLYGKISDAAVVAPRGKRLDDVHHAYVTMAAAGAVSDAQRQIFDDAAGHLLEDDNAVDAIILGGTDLALVYNANNAHFPLIDCANIHVDAIVRQALG